jgi:hypothetical protein
MRWQCDSAIRVHPDRCGDIPEVELANHLMRCVDQRQPVGVHLGRLVHVRMTRRGIDVDADQQHINVVCLEFVVQVLPHGQMITAASPRSPGIEDHTSLSGVQAPQFDCVPVAILKEEIRQRSTGNSIPVFAELWADSNTSCSCVRRT